jgi:hypothetical protein
MKINELYESLSPTAYHFTDFATAIKILRTDTLKGNAGSISFARSINGSYPKDYSMIGIIFEFDGRSLTSNKKAHSVGEEVYDGDKFVFSGRSTQQEDLVKSNQIKNVSKFITGAYIYLPIEYIQSNDSDDFDGVYSEQLKHLPKLLKMMGEIPFWVISSARGTAGANVMLRNIKPSYTQSMLAVRSVIEKLVDHIDDDKLLKQFNVVKMISWDVDFTTSDGEDHFITIKLPKDAKAARIAAKNQLIKKYGKGTTIYQMEESDT